MNAANLSRSTSAPSFPGVPQGVRTPQARLETQPQALIAQELWTDGDANEALLQDLASRMPTFVAIHDIQAGASLQLLQMFAMRFFRRIQALQIRHRQTRNLLATIQYLDLEVDGLAPIRLFACDIDAALPQRQLMARSLMAFSTLAVLLVGDSAAGGVASQLEGWRAQLAQDPWINRHMLVMPLSSSGAAITRNAQMGRATPVSVRVTPAAVSPDDAWNYISGAWRRASSAMPFSDSGSGSGFIGLGEPIRAPQGPADTAHSARSALATEPSTKTLNPAAEAPHAGAAASARLWRDSGLGGARALKPMPTVATASDSPSSLQVHCDNILELDGILAASIFDINTGLTVAQSGGASFTEQLARQGLVLTLTIQASARALGCSESATDVTIQWADKNLVLRHVPHMPHLCVAALTDRSRGNPVALRTAWLKLDAVFARETL